MRYLSRRGQPPTQSVTIGDERAFSCSLACAGVDECVTVLCGGGEHYLDPKVLVSASQQRVHILDHQLARCVQQVEVQIETQQSRRVHFLRRARTELCRIDAIQPRQLAAQYGTCRCLMLFCSIIIKSTGDKRMFNLGQMRTRIGPSHFTLPKVCKSRF